MKLNHPPYWDSEYLERSTNVDHFDDASAAQTEAHVPDYWSHDYSGLKHWGYAGDPYYASPDSWVETTKDKAGEYNINGIEGYNDLA